MTGHSTSCLLLPLNFWSGAVGLVQDTSTGSSRGPRVTKCGCPCRVTPWEWQDPDQLPSNACEPRFSEGLWSCSVCVPWAQPRSMCGITSLPGDSKALSSLRTTVLEKQLLHGAETKAGLISSIHYLEIPTVEAVHVFLLRSSAPTQPSQPASRFWLRPFRRQGMAELIWQGLLVINSTQCSHSFMWSLIAFTKIYWVLTSQAGIVLVGWVYVLLSQAGFDLSEPTALPVAIMWPWASELTGLRVSSLTYKMGPIARYFLHKLVRIKSDKEKIAKHSGRYMLNK